MSSIGSGSLQRGHLISHRRREALHPSTRAAPPRRRPGSRIRSTTPSARARHLTMLGYLTGPIPARPYRSNHRPASYFTVPSSPPLQREEARRRHAKNASLHVSCLEPRRSERGGPRRRVCVAQPSPCAGRRRCRGGISANGGTGGR
jgi:hypothetical protein